MAELSELESKVAEVMGLAQAAQSSTSKVRGLVDDEQLARTLEQMGREGAATEQRCAELEGQEDGDRGEGARGEVRGQRDDEQLPRDDADRLDGLEFLIMAEAGELGHVEIVAAMNEEIGDEAVRELVEFARPIQERHVEVTREAALRLAKQEALRLAKQEAREPAAAS